MEINNSTTEQAARLDRVPATHGDLNMIVAVMEDMTNVQTAAREKIVEHHAALTAALAAIKDLQATCGRLAQAVAELEERERDRS